ncbi:MAG TPA: hypothetical protein EYG30_03040 [Planctomycetes bacterium]|nr:hypothetical protein [Planctomycetota bacterium]HIL51218.1 hypothetical protein [Planctomycetota bacterium]
MAVQTFISALCLGTLWFPLSAPAGAQDNSLTSREQASLVEEQELLTRKLARLRDSMEHLVRRFDAEGRVHAARLLRDGLTHLSAGTDLSETNVEHMMSSSYEKLRAGQSMQAIVTQEEVIADLERLLAILMDRPDLDQLEESLAELKQLGAELCDLSAAEGELKRDTEALHEESKNESQRHLEASLDAALQKQRQLLAENEAQARQSGALDLEQLEAALVQLLEDQRVDSSVLESWQPLAVEKLSAPLGELARVRQVAARAERLADDAEALRGAAAEARDPRTDLDALARDLQEQAERGERDARAADDEAASSAADALARAAEELRGAADNEEQRAQAANELERLAEDLAQEGSREAQAAAEALSAAREALEAVESDPQSVSREAARQALQALGRAGDPAATAQAAHAADQGLRREEQELRFLGQALAASQAQNAERAEQLRQGLQRTPQAQSPGAERASAALENAKTAQEQAARSASEQDAAEAHSQAEAAEAELLRALEEISALRAASSGSQADAQALAKRQQDLAREVRELESAARSASLSEKAESAVSKALEEAAQAMDQAQAELGAGQRGAAASSQREASEALSKAAAEADAGVRPQTAQQEKQAADLAQRQEEIAKELFEFLERHAERDEAPPLPSLAGAQSSAQAAQESLEQGDLSSAQASEEETQRQIDEALANLAEEQEQYQQLRDEELLFQITEEVTALLAAHAELVELTLEVDAGRTPTGRASRGARLRLRKISREETALAARSSELRTAIEAEGSLVFAELLARAERDLLRVARETGESGGYKSGLRVQALQSDVSMHLTWLLEALNEELDRRDEEDQDSAEQPPGSEQESDDENRLVPDVAEMRLLARMEREVIDTIEELLVLYPELSGSEDIDALLLEDIQRLAVRHERASELFKLFRSRLGLPAPGLDPSHFSAPDEPAGPDKPEDNPEEED